MFETATFDSMGTIHTRSRNWMLATFSFNASILVLLIAIPLLHPAMLPQMVNTWLVEAPAPPPAEEPKPVVQQAHPTASTSEIYENRILAPRQIPRGVWISPTMEPPLPPGTIGLGGPVAAPGTGCDPFNCGHGTQPVVQRAPATQHISKGVMEGMLLNKVLPVYPPLALAMRVGGRVELQATISRSGTIENLRVTSGPAVLQQAAIDAVKQWRYRPYLLNGDPVEVETTIEVNFALN
jgi:protein TonB